ncbi:MAG: FG-GAP-like repeat-containing protein [Bacteroidetes bacterium]|nr:FG-GAP-like repeat-containing protein [Bacteroidota bacterium]
MFKFSFVFFLTIFVSFNLFAQDPIMPQFQNETHWLDPGVILDKSNVVVGEFNGDGCDDVLILNPITNEWSAYYSNGLNGFKSAVVLSGVNQPKYQGVLVGDFNGDGVDDKIAQKKGTATDLSGGWWVNFSIRNDKGFNFNFNNPSGINQRVVANPSLTNIYGNETNFSLNLTGDFNGDGGSDLLYCPPSGVSSGSWYLISNKYVDGTTGTFNSPPRLVATGQTPRSGVFVADLNNDGFDDKITYVHSGTNAGWYLAKWDNELLKFSNEVKISSNIVMDPNKVFVKDFNGDGYADILSFKENGTEKYWQLMVNNFTTGTERFWLPWDRGPGQGWNDGVWIGDFNGDGFMDKVTLANSNDPYWRGFWVTLNSNPSPKQVCLYFETIKFHFIDDTGLLNDNWIGQVDPQKTPVIGWAPEIPTTTGYYNSQNENVLLTQMKVIKKLGVDFIATDVTNWFTPDHDWMGESGIGGLNSFYTNPKYYTSREKGIGFDTPGSKGALYTAKVLRDNSATLNLKFAFMFGAERWGPSSFAWYDSQNDPKAPTGSSWWTNWNDQDLRYNNLINYVRGEFISDANYSQIYYKHLGKPLVLEYLDMGRDLPAYNSWVSNSSASMRKRIKLNDFTQRDVISWGVTYGLVDDWNVYTNNYLSGHVNRGIDVPGQLQRKSWGWGGGAKDIDANANTPIPVNAEVMSIMPGYNKWNTTEGLQVERQNGDFYRKQWEQVLKNDPKLVTICAFNEWSEESAIEGCVGENGWKDRHGTDCYDWYLQMTQKYIYLFKYGQIPNDTYFTVNRNTSKIYYKNTVGNIVVISNFPHLRADISIPSEWLNKNGIILGPPPTLKNISKNSAYPNPFNPETTISFELFAQEKVKVIIYNIMGQEVATLFNGMLQQGKNEVRFDGSKLSSGVYFYKIIAGNHSLSQKIILLK